MNRLLKTSSSLPFVEEKVEKWAKNLRKMPSSLICSGYVKPTLKNETNVHRVLFTPNPVNTLPISGRQGTMILPRPFSLENETLNYRTYEPVRSGLFCPTLFGPTSRFHQCPACGWKQPGLPYSTRWRTKKTRGSYNPRNRKKISVRHMKFIRWKRNRVPYRWIHQVQSYARSLLLAHYASYYGYELGSREFKEPDPFCCTGITVQDPNAGRIYNLRNDLNPRTVKKAKKARQKADKEKLKDKGFYAKYLYKQRQAAKRPVRRRLISKTSKPSASDPSIYSRCPRCTYSVLETKATRRRKTVLVPLPVVLRHPWYNYQRNQPIALVLGVMTSNLISIFQGQTHIVTRIPEVDYRMTPLDVGLRPERDSRREFSFHSFVSTFSKPKPALRQSRRDLIGFRWDCLTWDAKTWRLLYQGWVSNFSVFTSSSTGSSPIHHLLQSVPPSSASSPLAPLSSFRGRKRSRSWWKLKPHYQRMKRFCLLSGERLHLIPWKTYDSPHIPSGLAFRLPAEHRIRRYPWDLKLKTERTHWTKLLQWHGVQQKVGAPTPHWVRTSSRREGTFRWVPRLSHPVSSPQGLLYQQLVPSRPLRVAPFLRHGARGPRIIRAMGLSKQRSVVRWIEPRRMSQAFGFGPLLAMQYCDRDTSCNSFYQQDFSLFKACCQQATPFPKLFRKKAKPLGRGRVADIRPVRYSLPKKRFYQFRSESGGYGHHHAPFNGQSWSGLTDQKRYARFKVWYFPKREGLEPNSPNFWRLQTRLTPTMSYFATLWRGRFTTHTQQSRRKSSLRFGRSWMPLGTWSKVPKFELLKWETRLLQNPSYFPYPRWFDVSEPRKLPNFYPSNLEKFYRFLMGTSSTYNRRVLSVNQQKLLLTPKLRSKILEKEFRATEEDEIDFRPKFRKPPFQYAYGSTFKDKIMVQIKTWPRDYYARFYRLKQVPWTMAEYRNKTRRGVERISIHSKNRPAPFIDAELFVQEYWADSAYRTTPSLLELNPVIPLRAKNRTTLITSRRTSLWYRIQSKKELQKTSILRSQDLGSQLATKLEGFLLEHLTILPPALRPIIRIQSTGADSLKMVSDVNYLYLTILRRYRLLRLSLEPGYQGFPHYQWCIYSLMHGLMALFENEKLESRGLAQGPRRKMGVAASFSNVRWVPYMGIIDSLKGKFGMLRRNLLGKRCNYSGRSVIISGPELLIHQCGIPYEMAITLYRTFLRYDLIYQRRIAQTLSEADKLIQYRSTETYQWVETVAMTHPILLNRAPTLHRMGFQAFTPRLIDGLAVQLHPLVCPPFNADFDGDTMAIHLPMSYSAQVEAWTLLNGAQLTVSPASGEPSMMASQDIVLGCYALTQPYGDGDRLFLGRDHYPSNLQSAVREIESDLLDPTTPLWVRWKAPPARMESTLQSPLELRFKPTEATSHILYPGYQLHQDFSRSISPSVRYTRTTAGRSWVNESIFQEDL